MRYETPRNIKWPRVADVVRGRIEDGTLKPGDRPSVTVVLRELRVSRNTTVKAFAALESEGLLERRVGVGYVVLKQPG